MTEPTPDNARIAHALDEVGDLLQAQQASPFRIRAYHAAADRLRSLRAPVAEVAAAGDVDALSALPDIGQSLARTIIEFVRTGRLQLLDRLEGEVCPERLLASVPGIGPVTAQRIHDALHVDTLEQLEATANDGRLAAMRGMGPRRVAAIRGVLDSLLTKRHRPRAEAVHAEPQPAVRTLLELDAAYRRAARSGELPLIAPRRFNPEGKAWLPIMHVDRDGYHFTLLYSNTARAHRLGKTDDWVVIYYEHDHHGGQCTVVTEHRGPRAGARVVRGREHETPRPDDG